MTERKIEWAPDLPFMEVRHFIVERLRKTPPSPELSGVVCKFLEVPPTACTENLDSAISIIPKGWWWHLSHLEASVTPTVAVPGAPASNGTMYDFYGRPVHFHAMCFERRDLPVALCEALLKARYDLPAALIVSASALEENASRNRRQSYRHKLVGKTA